MEAKKYCYEYPRPALTTDVVVFNLFENSLRILFIKRGIEPFKGKWALPGGFVNMDETTREAASRELNEETGLVNLELNQLHTFSKIDRDPRHRTISVVYFALTKGDLEITAGDDARKTKWHSINKIPSLAFDHSTVIECAIRRLIDEISYKPLSFERFSVNELLTIENQLLLNL
jgi:8-oxo-dGTP diphosphatase